MPWGYSGIETLRRLSIPQLWVLAGSDSVAPSAPTITRLQQLRSAGSNIEIVVFPNTDHGIRNFTIAADGTRKAEGVADGYFRLLADWAKGVSAPPYATAILKAPASAAHKSMR